MSSVFFDRLPYVKILTDAGFNEEQASGLLEFMTQAVPEAVATKQHIDTVETNIQFQIQEVEIKLEKRIEEVRTELEKRIEEVKTELKSDIAEVKQEIVSLEMRMYKLLLAHAAFIIGSLTFILKFL